MNVHEKYMKRCLELAQSGFGKVAPNPMAGCVIVHEGKVIGEGFHKKYGFAHAEVNAIHSVKNKNLLKSATLYVNLEPCSHFGKTSPCADRIINSGVNYVVIGTIDPNPVVNGEGVQKLTFAGCDVKVGVLENECRELNKRFFTFHEKKRPYILLKWAETFDKYIGVLGSKTRISGSKANRLAHQWRSEEQAIMVGTHTALIDNPKLTARGVKGKTPIRVVIDKNLKLPLSFYLLDGSVPTILFTAQKKPSRKNIQYVTVDFSKNVLALIMKELYDRQIQSVIVEGGLNLLNSFLQNNLWDEARVFTAKKKLLEIAGKKMTGLQAPKINTQSANKGKMGSDELAFYYT